MNFFDLQEYSASRTSSIQTLTEVLLVAALLGNLEVVKSELRTGNCYIDAVDAVIMYMW